MYYADKLDILQDLFGTSDVRVGGSVLQVKSSSYPVVDDVIVLSPPEHYSPHIRRQLGVAGGSEPSRSADFAEDIQFSFGEEWNAYDQVLAEHEREFLRYFDLVPLDGLRDARVCDLGCGGGRWSYFLKDYCRELVLVDFSDAIFVARRNLHQTARALFFHCDLRSLPFRRGFADFLVCLGVLHHLPTLCLDEVRRLQRWAPRNLVFLYYALDNRPAYFRYLLHLVTALRLALSRVRHRRLRRSSGPAPSACTSR
jgi:SAM-dependent methyltransferase